MVPMRISNKLKSLSIQVRGDIPELGATVLPKYDAAFDSLRVGEATVPSRHPAPSSYPVSLRRPSLEYRHAFDLCAEAAHKHSLAPVLIATSPFYVYELTKRLSDCQTKLILARTGAAEEGSPYEEGETMEENLRYWVESETDLPLCMAELSTLETLDVKTRAVVWAEPEPQYHARILKVIRRMLLPGGELYVISSNGLAGILPEWQQVGSKHIGNTSRPAQHPAGLRQTLIYLRKTGFTIERLYGFRGPLSVFWAGMYYLAGYLGRQDWADRFHFKMRTEYVVQGAAALWTPVSVAYAYRPKSSVK
jgi:hypothetical protein